MLSEETDKPDLNYFNKDDLYEFRILSADWIKKLEDHTKGLGPLPSEIVNSDLLDEDKHNPDTRVFEWGSKRKHYNSILKKKTRFKKDFVICPDAVWQMISETHSTHEIVRKFYIENEHFVYYNLDFDTVSFADIRSKLFSLTPAG